MTQFDVQDFSPYLLTIAAETASAGFERHYKEHYGMLRTEWRVAFHLGRYGPMTAKDICTRARIHKTKVSRAVAALETKRYVTRKQLPEDRRHELLDLTKAGQRVFVELHAEAERYDRRITAQFSAEEIATLQKCLKQIAGFNAGTKQSMRRS